MKSPAQSQRASYDFTLLVLALGLVLFGIIMVFSSSAPRASYNFNNPVFFMIKQLVFAAIGTVFMFLFASIKYTRLQKGLKKLFLGSFILLIIVLFTSPVNGSRSWLSIAGFGIQPSELAKLATIIYLSALISKKGEQFRDFRRGFLPAALIVGAISFMIFLQPDIGSMVIFFASAFSVIIAGGTRLKILGSIFGVVASLGMLIFLFILTFGGLDRFGYIKARLGMDPWSDPLNTGYHLVNSLYAIGHGGFFGVGLGNSIQKLLYLPESHNDFIFPIIAEELGYIGVFIYFAIFLTFLWRALVLSLRSKDSFGMLAGTGIVCMLALQAFINIGGVTLTIPMTGVTLPFISYGGSSLLVVMMSVGVLLNISRRTLQLEKQEQGE
jgi:cell division protein FtsW